MMLIFRKFSLCALGFLCLLGSGCQGETLLNLSNSVPSEQRLSLNVQKQELTSGMVALRGSVSTSTPGDLFLLGFDQEKYTFRLAATNTRVSMASWSSLFPRSVAGINGVYFHEDLMPSGFFATKDVRQERRVFDHDKSALMSIEDRLRLLNTAIEPVDFKKIKQGAQSYPILIEDGRVKLTHDTEKLGRRSWIGVDRKGWVWVGVLPNGQVSLFTLAQRLMEIGVDWEMVVNLDGGPSTGLFFRKDGDVTTYETIGGVPNVLIIEKK